MERKPVLASWKGRVMEQGEIRLDTYGKTLHVAPEYEDCRRLAVEKNVPLQRVISEALRAYETASKTS